MAAKQRQGRLAPPAPFDDYFALAVTLWAMDTGEKPVHGQFNQRRVKASDLEKVQDGTVRDWVTKTLGMGGCEIY